MIQGCSHYLQSYDFSQDLKIKAARILYQSSLICGKRESFENQYDFILYDFVRIETYERWEKKKFIRGQMLTWLLLSVGAYTLAQA